jgi:peroxin-2
MTKTKYIAGRAFRLESHLLDQQLDETIDNFVDQLEISRFTEELKIILRLYLYANYVNSASTSGMKVYHMDYHDASSKDTNIQPRQKLIALTALNLTASYIVKRCRTLDKFLQNSFIKRLNFPWLNLDNSMLVFRSMNILNFFIFLKDGMYLTLPERILGLVPKVSDEDHYNNVHLNRTQMDYMYRDVVWRAIAEFLTAVIPLINIDQIKNRLSRLVGTMPDMNSDIKLADKIKRDITRCAICLKQPFNPYIIGCRHVFCYYCLHSKYLSDPSMGFTCIMCKYSNNDKSQVQRYRSLNLGDP